jgi:hypothetical protein
MKKALAISLVLIFTLSGMDLYAKGNGGSKKSLGFGGNQKNYSGQTSQNGFKTGDRALDGTGKGYGDGTDPQPKDGTGFGATSK